MYDRLKEQKQGISAAVIYRMIENEELEQKILLQKEFYTDDHCYWPKKEDGQAKQEQAVRNQNQWNKIARQTKMERTAKIYFWRRRQRKRAEEVIRIFCSVFPCCARKSEWIRRSLT